MKKSEIIDKINDALAKFRQEFGEEEKPKGVFLTHEIEKGIEKLKSDEVGSHSEHIFQLGAREAVTNLLGYKILGWEADEVRMAPR